MSFKKFAISLVTLASISLYTTCYAETKIGFVETKRLIESSTAHANILDQVQKKNESFRESVQKSEADLKKKYQDLETKKNALSQEAIDKKNEEISKEVAELQKKSYSQHSSLEEAYRMATQLVVDKANEIVKKYAEKNGYNAVLEKAAAVYSEQSLEVTDVILDELNKTLPKVEVKFEEDKPEAKKAESKK
jgi:Skp family chaperone for outer membrane proteins